MKFYLFRESGNEAIIRFIWVYYAPGGLVIPRFHLENEFEEDLYKRLILNFKSEMVFRKC